MEAVRCREGFYVKLKKKIEECGDMKERNGSFPSGGTANTTVQAVQCV